MIKDNSINVLVRCPINKLVDVEGHILTVAEKLKEPPKELVVWDMIEYTSPLNKWDGNLYNDKNIDSIDMQVTRPYKRVEQVTLNKTFGKYQTKIDKEK